MKIAIVIHAFYSEQLHLILNKVQDVLQKNQEHEIHIYITLPEGRDDLLAVIDAFAIAITVQTFPNKGMDLLPFLVLIPQLQTYDWVLKLHTKNCHDELNKLWFETLVNELVGSPKIFFDTVNILTSHQQWRMAGIAPFFLSAQRLMLNNKSNIDKLADLWQVDIHQDWGFFAGSLYWIKPQFLLASAQKILQNETWFDDNYAKDGLMAHAVERLITLVAQKHGEIGLFCRSAKLVYNHRNPIAINQAFSKQLLTAICQLKETVQILAIDGMFDVEKYAQQSQIDFATKELARIHYALIGQFSKLSALVLPITLQRKQEKLVSWEKLASQQRKAGLVSIIIPVFNELNLTLKCLKSIRKHTNPQSVEIIVVNNGSDRLVKMALDVYALSHSNCQIVTLEENLNFSVGCNYGFSQSIGEYVVFLNNDTIVTNDWLSSLLKIIQNDSVAIVQPLLLYPDDTVQCAGVVFGNDIFGVSRLINEPKHNVFVNQSCECLALTAACMLLTATDFIILKGFSTWYVNGQEDIDLCLRMKNLYPDKKLWYCADSIVYHYESRTIGRKKNISKNRQIFKYFWKELILDKQQELIKMKKYSNLSLANIAMRKKYYDLAEKLYLLAYEENAVLEHIINFNLQILYNKKNGRSLDEKNGDILKNKKDKLYKGYLLNYKSKDFFSQKDLCEVNIIENEGIFISENNDPLFLINADMSHIASGFYGMSFVLIANTNIIGQLAKLYVDYGNDFSEENCFSLSVKNGLNERVIYFDKKPVALRLDPLELVTEFILMDFELYEVNKDAIHQYFNRELKRLKKPISSNDISFQEHYNQYHSAISNASMQVSYYDWIAINEANQPEYYQISQLEQIFQNQVLFSIVIPVYNTDEIYLRECLDSILTQSFSNFEICIADDNSPKERVREVLSEYELRDSRVKVAYRKENGHISKASNSALELATGRFIVLVDHDDKLADHALYYVAQAIHQNPNAKIIYSDEDKIDEVGVRSSPHFKSDWNPDLFFSQNYVSHLGVYDSNIIKTIGGFRVGVEGSQDQDLLLRCLPHVQHNEIYHIPRVLYHWRMIVGSTAAGAGEKSYTTEAGIRALSDYFINNGPKGITVESGIVPNTYKVNWPIPTPAPKVSLLIPTRDGKDITEQAVRSILEKTTYPNYEILIIDNGSVKSETLEFFAQIQQEDDRVRVLRYDHPFNYSAINNYGVEHTDGEIIGLINNDVEVISPNWLTEMVSHAIRPDIGCVGAKLYYGNDTLQHAGVITSLGGVAGHSHKYFPRSSVGYFHRLVLVQNLTAVTAACLLVRREVYNQVGGLNEKDLTVAFNDVDFCLKVYSAGYRNLWTPYAELYHHESISRGAEDNPEKIARFNREVEYMKATWPALLDRDLYYSPNLTKAREDFSMNI